MVLPIDEKMADEMAVVTPPMKHSFPGLPGEVALDSFEDVIEILRRKQFRKDVFVQEATRLGMLLAERMEDAEGWHDTSRIEYAKAELSGQNITR